MARAANEQAVDLRVMHSSSFYVLGVASRERVVVLRRTSTAFPTPDVVRAENDQVIAAFRRCPGEGLVVDMRCAPPNNHEEFEEAMRGLRQAVGKAFRRVVVVVMTVSGEMQVTRLHRSDRSGYWVTREYAEAWQLACHGR